jgi:hypothetical protein
MQKITCIFAIGLGAILGASALPELWHYLAWSFAYNPIDSPDNISFRIYSCTNLAAPAWTLYGITNGLTFPIDTSNTAEFFRVTATNSATGLESK